MKTAKWLTGILGVIIAGYNILHLFDWESRFVKSSGYDCIPISYSKIIMYVVDPVVYSFAPFVLMFITNFVIVVKFMTAKCKTDSTESTNQALAKSATRGTAMVVTVSVTFLLLTLPTAVNQVLLHIIQPANNPLYRAFMNLKQYLNHSINGVLYCIVGSRFRMEVLKTLCRKKRTDKTSTSYSINNTSQVSVSEGRV